MNIAFLFGIACAQGLPGEELYRAPDKVVVSPPTEEKIQVKKETRSLPMRASENSNLPTSYQARLSRESNASELVLPPKGAKDLLRAIKVGDELTAEISHSVIAFPDEKSPVVATVSDRGLKGFKFIGESILEKNSKRIFIEFNRVIVGDKVYSIKAKGLSYSGQTCLIGEYHSREAEYFAGDFISSFVAGYFDGLVPKRTNFFGQVESDPSVDNAVKKGLASGALSSADRFREKLKKVPEFSELQGPFEVKVLILDQAINNQ